MLACPQLAASLFSRDGFVTSTIAFCGVIWLHALCEDLGVAYGMTLMDAPCAVYVVGMGVFSCFGHVLRGRNRSSD